MRQEISNILAKIKEEDLVQSVPSVSKLNGQLLYSLVLASGAKNMIELGTARGYSTIWIAAALEKTGGKIVTIDYSEPTLRDAEEHFRLAHLESHIETRLGNARIHLKEFAPESIDAIFLDCEKKATAEFFRTSWELLRPGGWILVDDVRKFAYKMEGFFETLADMGVEYEMLDTDPDDSVIFARKP